MITQFEAEVLSHTSKNGRYVTDEARVLEMAVAGLLRDFGQQALAGGAHYLEMAPNGRAAFSEWLTGQPKPKFVRRRVSPAFEGWRTYRELYRRISFSEFWKEIWPEWKHRA